MPAILHLTDLHLGTVADDDLLDDFKTDIGSLEERTTRHDLLRNTLGELSRQLAEPLAAVVVSGDVSAQNDPAGFGALPPLLALLGDRLPDPNRIVVVPGNHDVTWSTDPGSEARYEHFETHIRGAGYVTPLLDGRDFLDDGTLDTDPSNHFVLDPAFGWMILPLNTCNFSGSIEALVGITEAEWEQIPEAFGARADEVGRELARLRLHDVPRVSKRQLTALAHLIRHVERAIRDGGGDPRTTLRSLVQHHHLLPVSVREELTTFESLTNLGLLRNFIKERRIDLVLHGHKHTPHIYWDHVYTREAGTAPPHKTLVIAGASVGGAGTREAEVARVLRFRETMRAPGVSIAAVRPVEAGAVLDDLSWRRFELWHPEHEALRLPTFEVVSGKTADVVYDRVQALFEGLRANALLTNLICQVEDAQSAQTLPSNYPPLPHVAEEDRATWFRDLVGWWQRPTPTLAQRLYFTHGNRAYAYQGEPGRPAIDQVKAAARALVAKPESSRGVVVILDPRRDDLVDPHLRFPAFSLIQMTISVGSDGRRRLDCAGYFRKQDMTYWWPVNVAELAQIQEKALAEITLELVDVRSGSLTTVAALALAGEVLPRVAIPTVDRFFDEDAKRLWDMAYALFREDLANREAVFALWDQCLTDLIPEEVPHPDGPPIALEGLHYLSEVIESFQRHHVDDRTVRLAQFLADLYDLNVAYDQETARDRPTLDRHQEWRAEVVDRVERMNELIDDLRQGGGPAP